MFRRASTITVLLSFILLSGVKFANAAPVTLQNLVDDPTLQIIAGDKIFTNFTAAL